MPEDENQPPFNSCPGCGAVPTLVRGEWETVHDDDCDWFHDAR